MINKKQIEYLAKLAKLDISEEEKAKYAEQISAILVYFAQLNEIDTESVSAVDHITGLQNVSRPDAEKIIFSKEDLIDQADQITRGQVNVPAVFDKE
jgi:aspartyl-tRNA(Asn)/glutamyl-tRNA(Gln) amidotransferase subunit C